MSDTTTTPTVDANGRTNVTPTGYSYQGQNYQTVQKTDGQGNPYTVDVPTGSVTPVPTPVTTTNAAVNLNNLNNTGINTTAAGTGSVIGTSAPVVAQENNTIKDLQNLVTNDTTANAKAHQDYLDMIKTQTDALEARRTNEINNINNSFDSTKTQLKDTQAHEVGTFSATLQRIGGYLGDSASASGAMINLNQKHTYEINDLEAKRQAALQAAKTAVDDKEFQLAQAKVQEAKDYAKQIQDSKQTYFDNAIKIMNTQSSQAAAANTATKNKLDTLSTAVIPHLVDQLNTTTDPKAKEALIQTYADNYGFDTNTINSLVNNYKQEQIKASPEVVKEYEFYKNQTGYSGSILDYQRVKALATKITEPGKSDVITQSDISTYGLPKEAAGMPKTNFAYSLTLDKMPDWFTGYINNYAKDQGWRLPLTKQEIQDQWTVLKNNPDIKVFTDVVTKSGRSA